MLLDNWYLVLSLPALIGLMFWVVVSVFRRESSENGSLRRVGQLVVFGCGVTFYGKRDFSLADGPESFLTTSWIVIFMVPIMPLYSVRMQVSGVELRGPRPTVTLRLYGKSKPHLKQVLGTYSIIAFEVLLLSLGDDVRALHGWARQRQGEIFPWAYVYMAAFLLPIPIVWGLRLWARKRAGLPLDIGL